MRIPVKKIGFVNRHRGAIYALLIVSIYLILGDVLYQTYGYTLTAGNQTGQNRNRF
jgi:hypothetical protein